MNSRRLLIALTVGALGVTSIAGAGIALADDGAPGPGAHAGFMRGGHGPAEGRGPANTTEPGARQDQMHQAAATALGISVDELEAQLAEGKTVAQIATERGVDLATVQAAMQSQRPAGAQAGVMRGGHGPANATEPGARQDQMHEAAATALGITVEELEAQLAEGKTVAQIATERGVDLATVQAAMQAERPAGAHAGRMAGKGTGDCPYSTTN